MADAASNAYNADILMSLSDNERNMVRRSTRPSIRSRSGTYGICEECEEPINEKRLEANPVARYCISCKRMIEEKGAINRMKYKIAFLFLLLFFVAYVLLSSLNGARVRVDAGFGVLPETSVANYIAAAFLLGVVVSLIAGFFTDVHRGLAKWRGKRKERLRTEAKDLVEKGETLREERRTGEGGGVFQPRHKVNARYGGALPAFRRHVRGEGRGG